MQLIDARDSWSKMRKSLGEKRKQLDDDQIADIVRLYGAFEENDRCKILPNEAFGFMRITVERPMRRVWTVTDDQIDQVKAHRTFDKLSKTERRGRTRQLARAAKRPSLPPSATPIGETPHSPCSMTSGTTTGTTLEHRGLKLDTQIRKMMDDVLGVHGPGAVPSATPKADPNPTPICVTPKTSPCPPTVSHTSLAPQPAAASSAKDANGN